MSRALIFDAIRTPRGKGKPDGALASVTPHELIRQLVDELRRRHGAAALEAVQRFVLGCVTQVGVQGGHVALMARNHAQLPDEAVALTINNYCVSGMSALAAAARSVATGEDSLALAGGVESMSQAPFEGDRASFFADRALAAQLRYVSPPIVGDLLATLEALTRKQLDEVTVESHRRASAAWSEGRYASSVVPVIRGDGTRVERDELIRPGLTTVDLARFGPAFAALGEQGHDALLVNAIPGLREVRHLHSVAHCPPIADGASLILLGSAEQGEKLELRARAEIAVTVELNTDPLRPFEAGFACMQRAVDRAGISLEDLGAIEFMEAFAAVPAKFRRDLPIDPERVNASGGHLAMGHPMGASGAILVTTLLAEMERRRVEWGLAVAHAVSGVGAAVLLRRIGR